MQTPEPRVLPSRIKQCIFVTMPGSDSPTELIDYARNLASGAWAELGVPGRARSHTNWAVDLEPLILFTAWLGDRDTRLLDEATQWCIRNVRLVSKTRLKNLVALQPDEVGLAFGVLAATVEAATGVPWPAATVPREFNASDMSMSPSFTRPGLVWLRMRAMFGIGARAEILRCMLCDHEALGVARLAVVTGYTKRNVADECEVLQRAGVLAVRTLGNRFYYSLARRTELLAFVGELPGVLPNGTAVFNVARGLVTLEHGAEVLTERTLTIQARRTVRLFQSDLADLDIAKPSDDVSTTELWPLLHQLGARHLGAWSVGQWPSAT